MIEFDYGDAVAAVVDVGGVWGVTPDVGRAEPYPLRHDGVDEVGLPDGRWIVAGFLPPGAVRAVAVGPADEVEAAMGDGVFLVVGGRMVRFFDAGGAVVPSKRVTGSPITDAEVDCPLCGARDWVVMAHDEVACRRCGFELQSSLVYAYLDEDAEPDVEAEAAWRREQEAEMRRVLTGLTLPVLVLESAPTRAVLAGWGGGVDRTTAVTLQHAGVSICLERRERFGFTIEHEARGSLAGILRRDDEWPGVSPAALHLWMEQRSREAEHAAALAVQSDARITIDGEPVDALVLRADGGWAVAFDHGDVRVFLTSREAFLPVALRTLADPAGELDLTL